MRACLRGHMRVRVRVCVCVCVVCVCVCVCVFACVGTTYERLSFSARVGVYKEIATTSTTDAVTAFLGDLSVRNMTWYDCLSEDCYCNNKSVCLCEGATVQEENRGRRERGCGMMVAALTWASWRRNKSAMLVTTAHEVQHQRLPTAR